MMDNERRQFLNSLYIRRKFQRNEMTNKSEVVSEDALLIYYKDSATGPSKLDLIEKPVIDYYILKKEYWDDPEYGYHRLSMPIDKLERRTCRYAERDLELAKAIGKTKGFFNAAREGFEMKSMFMNTEVYNDHRLYLADANLESFYKMRYHDKYGEVKYPLRKGFMDIEVRTYDLNGASIDSDSALGTINIITHINEFEKTIYTYVLTDKSKYPTGDAPEDAPKIYDVDGPITIDEFILNKQTFISKMFQSEDMESVKDFNFVLRFFSDENKMLKAYLRMIDETKPDFVGIWNMRFDVPYISNRLIRYGEELSDLYSSSYLPKKYRNYYYKLAKAYDSVKKSRKHFSRLFDWVQTSSHTQFYDMMSLYSVLRNRSILPSYKLDNIVGDELGKHKMDFREYGCNMRTAELKRFDIFVNYNIIDVVRIMELEQKVGDLDKLLLQAGETNIEYFDKISITIKDDIWRTMLNEGHIIGNNVTYSVDSGYIPGALVGSPEKLKELGIKILGKESYVYEDVVDLDEKAQYPSTMDAWQIIKTKIYGRCEELIVDGNIDNSFIIEDVNRKLQTLDASIFELAEKYLGLPAPDKIIGELEKCLE